MISFFYTKIIIVVIDKKLHSILYPLPQPRKKESPEEQNDFAILLRDLTQEGWIIISVAGNADSALYTLERFEKRKR